MNIILRLCSTNFHSVQAILLIDMIMHLINDNLHSIFIKTLTLMSFHLKYVFIENLN